MESVIENTSVLRKFRKAYPTKGYFPGTTEAACHETCNTEYCIKRANIELEKQMGLYFDFLYSYTYARINDEEIAKDLVQETFLSALKGLNNFEYRCSISTWLISILKRKIVDYYRKINSLKGKAELRMNNHNEKVNAYCLENYFPDYNFYSNPEMKIENVELGETISRCVEKLPEKHRIIFKMKTMDEMNTKDICGIFDITPQNLWTIMHRARLELIYSLEKSGYAPRNTKSKKCI